MKKTLLFAVIAAILSVSCAKEIDDNNQSVEGPSTYTLYAFPATRTTLDNDVFNWASGETIAVADETTSAKEFTISPDAEERAAGKFTFNGSITGSLRYAISPASAATIPSASGSNVNITLPDNYSYVEGQTNAVMVSTAPVQESGKYTAHFAHTMALVKVSYVNVPYGTKVFKLTMDQNISGVTVTKDASSAVVISTSDITGESAKKYVTVTLSSAVTSAGSSMDFYVPVPVGTYGNFKAQLFDSTDKVLNEKNKTFAVGKELTLSKADVFATPVINAKGDEWDYTFASGDLVVSPGKDLDGITVVSSIAQNGFEDSGSERGVQYSSGNTPTITIPYSGGVESVKLVLSTNGTASATVKVGGTTIGTSGTTISSTANQTYTFATTNAGQYLRGDVVLTFTNSKSLYIKRVIINEDSRTAQALSFPEDSYKIQVDGSFAEPDLSGAKTTVSYKSSDSDVASVDKTTGEITLKAAGTTVITATAEADETYKKGSASYTLLVTPVPVSLASAIAASANASVCTRGVVANINKKGYVLTDGTDNLFIYLNAQPEVSLGDDVTIVGTRSAYNGVPQLSEPEVLYTNATGQSYIRTGASVITSSNCTGITASSFVSVTGTLTRAGAYYSVAIPGTVETKATLFSPDTDYVYADGKLSAMESKSVVLTGYAVGSTSDVLYVSAVDVVRTPFIEHTNPTQANAADGSTATFTVTSNVTWTVDVKTNGSYLKSAIGINSTTGVVTLTFNGYTNTETDRTVTVTLSSTDGSYDYSEDIVVTQKKKGESSDYVIIGTYATANDWENGTAYSEVEINSNITATVGGTGDNGKYYSNDNTWRLYQNGSGILTIEASTGTIKKVKVTFTTKDNGQLKKSGTAVSSDTDITVNASSVSFSVDASSGTKGKVFVTRIDVTYE